MTKIYACLTGNWVCLNDDQECKIGKHLANPATWWKENADVWCPNVPEQENTLYQMPYVNIHFLGKDYRISPIFIQVVEEK